MTDTADRLRLKANDLYKTDGDAMKMWDDIRRILKPQYGGTMPREMFECFIEDIADKFVDAADELDVLTGQVERLRTALEEYGQHVIRCDYDRPSDPKCTCGFAEALTLTSSLR